MTKGASTRERILSIAEASVLAKGFAATSIEEIIAEANLTKSGFFYHFSDKNQLAHEMLRRYVTENDRIFDMVFGRAAELSDDPLERFLIGLKMLAEVLHDLPGGHPGCLIASICYQERLFDRELREICAHSVSTWNDRFLGYLQEIEEMHPKRGPIDLRSLANMLSCLVDGAIIMAKVLKDPLETERQVLAYRSIVKSVFER